MFGEWLRFQHLTHSVFYCSSLGALKINLKERTVGKSHKWNSKGMNLSFRTDLSSNRAVPVWGKDRHPHCKARSAKNQPLLQVQVGGRRRSVHSHKWHKPACPRDVALLHTLYMGPSSSLRKVLASSYKQFDCMHRFFLLPKVWAIHLYLFIHLFSRKLMVRERLSTNCAW